MFGCLLCQAAALCQRTASAKRRAAISGLCRLQAGLPRFSCPLSTFFVYIRCMETIPLGELNHHPSRVTARVRAGETLVVTEHGKPVIRMSPAEEPTSALDQLFATGQVRRAVNPGALPELISDLAELPSLSDALIAERDRERTR
jgi:prevent-host-death family protein